MDTEQTGQWQSNNPIVLYKQERSTPDEKPFVELRQDVPLQDGRVMSFVKINEPDYLNFTAESGVVRNKGNIQNLTDRFQELGVEIDSRQYIFFDTRTNQISHIGPKGTVLSSDFAQLLRDEHVEPKEGEEAISLLGRYATRIRADQEYKSEQDWHRGLNGTQRKLTEEDNTVFVVFASQEEPSEIGQEEW